MIDWTLPRGLHYGRRASTEPTTGQLIIAGCSRW